MRRLFRFLREEQAATAVEYAVMLGLVILACIASIVIVGESTLTLYENSSTRIDESFNGE